jgi:hypothetical protein
MHVRPNSRLSAVVTSDFSGTLGLRHILSLERLICKAKQVRISLGWILICGVSTVRKPKNEHRRAMQRKNCPELALQESLLVVLPTAQSRGIRLQHQTRSSWSGWFVAVLSWFYIHDHRDHVSGSFFLRLINAYSPIHAFALLVGRREQV